MQFLDHTKGANLLIFAAYFVPSIIRTIFGFVSDGSTLIRMWLLIDITIDITIIMLIIIFISTVYSRVTEASGSLPISAKRVLAVASYNFTIISFVVFYFGKYS